MKIIERVERNGPQKPAGIVTPVRMAILAVIVIVGAVIASFFMPSVPLQLMCYVIAGVLLLWLLLISGLRGRQASSAPLPHRPGVIAHWSRVIAKERPCSE